MDTFSVSYATATVTRPTLPWRRIALEAVGYAPDSLRGRVAKRRKDVKTLTTVQQLDAHLARAAELFPRSDDEARRFLSGFEFAAPQMPADPFSPEYAKAQWELYRKISGRDRYDTTNEEVDIDLERCVQSPYPYSTGSSAQVADQLAVCSFIFRLLNPQPGQRIVEFGPGWGNLTVPLAMMSVDITAVEVSPTFAELLRRRAAGNDHLTVVESGMLDFKAEGRFGAALFFESFHHCSDHLEMLHHLRSIVSEDGVVMFAAEPVTWMPYPWGLRLDGLSLWCTRSYGWLELGFDNRYFDEALKRAGWRNVRRERSRSLTPLADVILARRTAI
jgi:2-polyprenyl-3-methyl-5-hydroxy-6-metoxy-1,4-benzoquinol methylase